MSSIHLLSWIGLFQFINAFEFNVYIYSIGGEQTPITDNYGGGSFSQIMFIDPITKTSKSDNLIANVEAGVNIVIIDENDATFIESHSFYKWNEDSECAQYLNALPEGHIVLVSVYDTAEVYSATRSVFQSWGCPSGTLDLVGWLSPFIFVGTAGSSDNPSWTYCETTHRSSAPLNRTFTIPFVQTWEPTDDPTTAPTSSPLDYGSGGLYCSDTLVSDSLIPSNPGISSLPNSLPTRIESGYSELVDVPTMGDYDASTFVYERHHCPHLWIGLSKWEALFPSQSSGDITIPLNTRVILTKCSLDVLTNPSFDRIYVPGSSHLIFDDSDITLSVKEILVEGVLWIGSSTCRLYSTITINFEGEKAASNLDVGTDYLNQNPSKGLVVDNGVLEMHGKQYVPTWTRLARIVNKGDDIIYLQDCVNWEVGMRILLTTTVWFDCHDDYKDTYCLSDYSWKDTTYGMKHQNEVFEIVAIDSCTILQIDGNVNFTHFASNEYQGEVALLDRRIKVNGQQTTQSTSDAFGAHIRVQGSQSIGRIRGVQCTNCGQLNVLGRYPFHFHLLGDAANARTSYLTDNVVFNSNYRCYTVHGTNHTHLSGNIGFDVRGMCFYLEDGVEENNTLQYNLAAFIHPIQEPADCCGQGGESFWTSENLVTPVDTTAGGYYLPNAYNTLIGNVASGGWSGFIFPNVPLPLGVFHGVDNAYNNPIHRPVQKFYGNTAHSSGFYWKGQGSCVYVGAWVTTEDGTVNPPIVKYNSGRNDRETKTSNGTRKWMLFEHSKAFLCMFGISHWGNEMIVEHYEVHDSLISAQYFGEGAMYNAIITGRTENANGWSQQEHHYAWRIGFRYYDTWTKTIISNIEFRNYQNYAMDRIIKYLDHSDEFLPQGINAAKDITFVNVNTSLIIGIDHCGQYFCGDYHETVAAQIYNIYDFDGSLSLSGKPTLIGSYRNWWNVADDCTYSAEWHIWYCDWTQDRQIAFLDLVQPGVNDHGCDPILTHLYKPEWCRNTSINSGYKDCNCSQTSQFTAYSTAYVSQWGETDTINHGFETKSIEMHGWPGVSGIANTGWYWRPYWGAPDRFEIGSSALQIARGYFVILAVKYPAKTVFNVSIYSNWAEKTAVYLDESALQDVLKPTEDLSDSAAYNCTVFADWYSLCSDAVNGGFVESTGGVGPAWHFDGTYLLVRVVNPMCYSSYSGYSEDCQYDGWFEYDDAKIWDIYTGLSYVITAQCDGCKQSFEFNNRTYWQTKDVIVPCTFEQGYCNQKGDKLSAVAETVFAVIFVILIALLIGMLIWKRFRKEKETSETIKQTQQSVENDAITAD
eukprot:358096_1